MMCVSYMAHLCAMMISPGIFFFFFQNFFSGFLGGQKGKKWSKMKKNSVCCTPYLWNHTSYDCYLWYTFVNDISRCFFNFKILIFWVVRGPKWQNFLSAAPYILGTIYHVILIYDTHVSFFFSFKMLIFGIIRGVVKGQKIAKNDKKFCPSHSVSQEPNIIWLWFMVCIYKMMISPIFFIFQNFDFGVL